MTVKGSDLRPGPKDLLAQLATGNMQRRAKERQVSLSALLEMEDPSNRYPGESLDAFGRLLKEANIRTRDVPEWGIFSDTVEIFSRDPESRALFGEWIYRRWREAASGRDPSTRGLFGDTDPATRALLTSQDYGAGTALNQIAFAAAPRVKQIAPAIPIEEIVATTTPIDGGTYEAFYLTDVAASERTVRIAEGAEVPTTKLSGGDHVIRLRKFGRALEATYEQLRRQRIDVLALHIARMAVQAEVDKVAAIIDVMVNGDGNASTAATNYNLTTLDSGTTANNLTLKAWLAFKAKFLNPYSLTHILAQEAAVISTQLLNTGNANIPLVSIQAASGFGGFRPINPELGDDVRYGLTADAPTAKIVGIDGRFAIERVVENGSDITETTRWIERQAQRLVMTVDEAYAVFDQNAVKTMNLAA